MAVGLKEFIKRLTDATLMSADEVRAFLDRLPSDEQPRTGKEFAEQLARHKRLTPFQAQAVYDSKGEGLVLGNYVILDRIGQGGMGTVFKAEHRGMKRVVALKVLAQRLTKTPEALKRFHREVRAAAALDHPNIVTAYDAAEAKGARYLVMEYVDGADLASVVKSTGPLPVKRAVRYVLQVARALEYAHGEGIIHRDIKPANLLVDRQNHVKVLDLGLARIQEPEGSTSTDSSLFELTRTGMVLGTVDYMPPEQALGTKDIDHRADIYSLGISLYYLLAGRVPYAGSTLLARFLAHREQEIPSLQESVPDVPDALDRVFRKMVAKEAKDRYATMSEVVADLEACLAESPASSVTLASPEPDSAWMEVLRAASSPALREAARAAAPPVADVTQAAVTMPAAQVETRQTSRAKVVQLTAKSVAQSLVAVRVPTLVGVGCGGLLVLIGLTLLMLYWRPSRQDVNAYRRPPSGTNSIGMKLVLIPAGEFLMGSPEGELEANADEKPQHTVRITQPFYLGVTEVTQEQYERVTGQNPSDFKGDPQRPVEMVSWEDAVAFCRKLSEKEGRAYRLPTEAEWEYACRAGSKTKWPFGDDDSALKQYAWYDDGAGGPHPAAQKKPNAWGLYDMHGNVWEWCQDWYHDEYYAQHPGQAAVDPAGPNQGVNRVLRGGSWFYYSRGCRPAYRLGEQDPGFRSSLTGFRLALGGSSEGAR